MVEEYLLFILGMDQGPLIKQQLGRLSIFTAIDHGMRPLLFVLVRTILDLSRVLQILFRIILIYLFKNFDKVNAHLVYLASATISQDFRAETPNFCVHAHSLCQNAS